MGNSVEILLSLDKQYSLFSPCLLSQSYQKAIRLVMPHSSYINTCWLFSDTFLSFVCLEMLSRINCSNTFPGTDVSQTGLDSTGSSFLPFLKIAVTFACFQSSGTSTITTFLQEWSSMTSANSLSTHECILIRANRLGYGQYVQMFLNQIILDQRQVFLALDFCMCFRDLALLKTSLPSKDWDKESSEYFGLFHDKMIILPRLYNA